MLLLTISWHSCKIDFHLCKLRNIADIIGTVLSMAEQGDAGFYLCYESSNRLVLHHSNRLWTAQSE